MALQTDNLGMIGLSVASPPFNQNQPQLLKGIHLRWAFERELGFPWHGFYLFRRPAQRGNSLCLGNVIGGLKAGALSDNKQYTALGVISSDQNLVLTDSFAPAGQVEFDLGSRSHMRFDLPPGEPARRIDLKIGFRAQSCLDFKTIVPGPAPSASRSASSMATGANPLNQQGVMFTVKAATGLAASTQIESVQTSLGELNGLNCGYGVVITLPKPTSSIELLITRGQMDVNVKATNASNQQIAAPLAVGPNQTGTVKLTLSNITKIEIETARNQAYLHRTCFDSTFSFSSQIEVIAFSGETPVRSVTLSGQNGQVDAKTLEFDAITAIEISPGPAALVDLCYVPVAQDATLKWEKLPEFDYPMGLPVAHPQYPCTAKDDPAAAQLVLNRMRSQLPPGWIDPATSAAFSATLRAQLQKLVEGGPSGTPMAEVVASEKAPASALKDEQQTLRFSPLDLTLIGALHPSLAKAVGLYWVDSSLTATVTAYDYLIVADYTGVGQHSASQVLSLINTSGFTQLDGYIVFNKSTSANDPNLTPPSGLRAYALPGGGFPNAKGEMPAGTNNAGLCWDLGLSDAGALLPDRPILYQIWRSDLGNGAAPATGKPYALVTPRPCLVTEARLPKDAKPDRALDWPPFQLHYIDRNLPEGWYSYQASGIDLFGRCSKNSPPSIWFQWQIQADDPAPWYYEQPSRETNVKLGGAPAIQLLDKNPPPSPPGVEASVLDPEDPFLVRDPVYLNWYSKLRTPFKSIIGVRARWKWTTRHQALAPDTREFRLYFHPGVELPVDYDRAINWQNRYYVVGYNENVTVDQNNNRFYEILLPPPVLKNLTSLPLTPTLVEPIAYAYIGVSAADDKPHTKDLRTTGDWGNRPGNEGRIGPVAKIFRVLRTPPPAPEAAQDGERFYASPADYHSRSFFTYRWKPQQYLKLHVFRALDEAVFKADWAERSSKMILDESQLALFPPGWNTATRKKVADELNLLNGFNPANDTELAMAYYRQLSDAALRVLAGLPSSENAFVQQTINPLDPDDPANANRKGPDTPDYMVPDNAHRAFVDTLDGRSTNRYFYRAAFVDAAHNLGPMGLATPPVYLHKVTPPKPPILTKVRSGERQIELHWVKSREEGIRAYRVYRTSDAAKTDDIRRMELVQELAVTALDPNQVEAGWVDKDAPAGVDLCYRLTALDSETPPNESAPSKVVAGRAVDTVPPKAPEWISAEWGVYDVTTGVKRIWPHAGNIPDGHVTSIFLTMASPSYDVVFYRRIESDGIWNRVDGRSQEVKDGVFEYVDLNMPIGYQYYYRAVALNSAGLESKYSEEAILPYIFPES